jgi:hypothetical protein
MWGGWACGLCGLYQGGSLKRQNWRSSVLCFLSNPPGVSRFRSATTMAPPLDVTTHILIETLLKQGLENKLIASEASCSVRTVQRIRLKGQQFEISGGCTPSRQTHQIFPIFQSLQKIPKTSQIVDNTPKIANIVFLLRSCGVRPLNLKLSS